MHRENWRYGRGGLLGRVAGATILVIAAGGAFTGLGQRALGVGGGAAPTPPVAPAAPSPASPAPAAPSSAPPALSPGAKHLGPRLEVEAARIDYGRVARGAIVRRVFRLRNVGDETLVILRVRTSCGCTAALPTARRLAPGERGGLEVRFDTGKKEIRGGSQQMASVIRIYTNDPVHYAAGRGVVPLMLVGEVTSAYRIVPTIGAVLRVRQGDENPAGAHVAVFPRKAGGRSLARAKLVSAPDGMRVEALVPVGDAGGVALTVRATVATPAGPIHGNVVLDPGAGAPLVYVPVRGEVSASVRAEPARLLVPGTIGEAQQSVRLIAMGSGVRLVRMEIRRDGGAESALGFSAPELPARLPGRLVLRRARVGDAPLDEERGEIWAYVTDPFVPVVRVPYRVVRTGAGTGSTGAPASPSSSATRAPASRPGAGTGAGSGAGSAPASSTPSSTVKAFPVRVSPPELEVGTLPVGRARSLAVSVTDPQGELALTELAVVGSDAVTVHASEVRPGVFWRLTIRVQPTRPGPIAATVQFRPRSGASPVEIPVHVRARGRVIAAPFGAYLAKGAVSADIVLRRLDTVPLRITAASDPRGRFLVTVSPEGDAVRVRVRRGPKSVPDIGFGVVRITTDSPGEEALSLPVVLEPAGFMPAADASRRR